MTRKSVKITVFGITAVRIGTYTAWSSTKVVVGELWSRARAPGPDFISNFTDFMTFPTFQEMNGKRLEDPILSLFWSRIQSIVFVVGAETFGRAENNDF